MVCVCVREERDESGEMRVRGEKWCWEREREKERGEKRGVRGEREEREERGGRERERERGGDTQYEVGRV